ncbi:MAG: CoA transferase [Thiolinea sp.]
MTTFHFLPEIAAAFGHQGAEIQLTGQGDLPSCFRVTDLAAESIAYAGALIERYRSGDNTAAISVDRRLASFWFDMTIRPQGWLLPSIWDAVAGDYATADGWIRLHTNAPHHRKAALSVLGCEADRGAVATAVQQWRADELEQAIVEQGGCAAAMRSMAGWAQHRQGQAVSAEPLVNITELNRNYSPSGDAIAIDALRPLRGVKVLDLTRVLAGPVAGRFLAAYGAEVLRIDPPDWDEPAVIPEVVLGKRCARLDLRRDANLEQFKQRLAECDVILHGYRPGALDSLGLSDDERYAINPHAVDVALCAYGWSGPWASRRGFDSLVQMSCGIAQQGMESYSTDKPKPLPVQALDHATGYLLAAAVINGLLQRREQGTVTRSRLSLARTACLLQTGGSDRADKTQPLEAEGSADINPLLEQTSWGPAQRVNFPLFIPECPAWWQHPAKVLGSAEATHW